MKYHYLSRFMGTPACARCLLANGLPQPDGTVRPCCMVQPDHPPCPPAGCLPACPLEDTGRGRNGCREYRFAVDFADAPKCAVCPLAHHLDFSNGNNRLKCTGLTVRQFCGLNEQVLADCPLRSADSSRR